MQSRNFICGTVILSFLLFFSGPAFVNSEAPVNDHSLSRGIVDSQYNKMLMERIEKTLEAKRSALIELYHDLHRHPEVSGQEERTAGIIANQLRDLGLEVKTGIGGHGVVGIIKGAKPGPVVAYRADMDAVFSKAPMGWSKFTVFRVTIY